jgi:hypothetical protein
MLEVFIINFPQQQTTTSAASSLFNSTWSCNKIFGSLLESVVLTVIPSGLVPINLCMQATEYLELILAQDFGFFRSLSKMLVAVLADFLLFFGAWWLPNVVKSQVEPLILRQLLASQATLLPIYGTSINLSV